MNCNTAMHSCCVTKHYEKVVIFVKYLSSLGYPKLILSWGLAWQLSRGGGSGCERIFFLRGNVLKQPRIHNSADHQLQLDFTDSTLLTYMAKNRLNSKINFKELITTNCFVTLPVTTILVQAKLMVDDILTLLGRQNWFSFPPAGLHE